MEKVEAMNLAIFDVQETLVVMCMIPCPLIVVLHTSISFPHIQYSKEGKPHHKNAKKSDHSGG